jgi:DNA-binding transcriptional LysR family regulator
MDGLTLHQLQCFDAVVSEGGFRQGAAKLHRSHSAVFTAMKKLEDQLGLRLLDREGYRVTLTDAGRSFHRRTRVFLRELSALRDHATQLATGEETELRIVIGDICPLPKSWRCCAVSSRIILQHALTCSSRRSRDLGAAFR